jgi:hypothetical protein
MGSLLWPTGRPLGMCVQRPHSWGRVLAGGKRVYANGGQSLGGMSFAMEKSRLKGGCSQDWLPHKGLLASVNAACTCRVGAPCATTGESR